MDGKRELWAVVLSGGEGLGLRSLVRRATGEARPKQYAKLLGPRSLLRQTLDRVALAISSDRTVLVTVRTHTAYIAEEFRGATAAPYVLVQPSDRGTAAGVLHAAHWITRRSPEATLAVFPSDHFVLGEATFMGHVVDVAAALDRHPDRVVLLGAPASSPGGEHGWIDAGSPIDGPCGLVSTVRRLCPDLAEAGADPAPGTDGLWNTTIVLARGSVLIELGGAALPDMSSRLARIGRFADSDEEPAAVHQAYALMTRASFARDVLERYQERLGVSRLSRVTWSDLGRPRDVLDVLARMRVRPTWADLEPPAVPA